MRSYNLFRLNDGNDLACAVPETRAVPGFVSGRRWSFSGRIDETSRPPGFDDKAAATAVRFNGYYLFAPLDRRRP